MPWEYAMLMQVCRLPFSSTIIYRTMYDTKAVIALFLRKLQQNFAQSQYFPIHTVKRAVFIKLHKCKKFLKTFLTLSVVYSRLKLLRKT